VGMRKAPLGQCFDFLKAEGHLDHGLPPAVYPKLIHQRPYRQSSQSSTYDRAQYSPHNTGFFWKLRILIALTALTPVSGR
jgi:hypothetical protein